MAAPSFGHSDSNMGHGMHLLIPVLTFLAIGAVSASAPAGVIARDLAAPGDGLLTYDTINRRDWLDLPMTAGVSLAEVLAEIEPGGRLEGFRFAKLADVSALAASAEVGWTTFQIPFDPAPKAAELVELLGWVVSGGGVVPDLKIAMGLIAADKAEVFPTFDDTNFYVVSIQEPSVAGQFPRPGYTPVSRGGVFTSGPFPGSAVGVGEIGPFWLYRNVPEPGVALLVATPLTGLICARRNRSRNVTLAALQCA
jgi:hypothetical protein